MKKHFILALYFIALLIGGLRADENEDDEWIPINDDKMKILLGPKYSCRRKDFGESRTIDYIKYGISLDLNKLLASGDMFCVSIGYRVDFDYINSPGLSTRPGYHGISTENALSLPLGVFYDNFVFYIAPGAYVYGDLHMSSNETRLLYLYGNLVRPGMRWRHGRLLSSVYLEYRYLEGYDEDSYRFKEQWETSNDFNKTKQHHIDVLLSAGYAFDYFTIEPAFTMKTRNYRDSFVGHWSGWRDFSGMEYSFIMRFGVYL